MRILLVGFSTRTFIPYIDKYEKVLRQYNCSYDVLFWDRLETYPLKKVGNEYYLGRIVPNFKPLKIPCLLEFRITMKNLIKQSNYTHVIVLTTLPAILIHRTLITQFKEKFILDIRDYSYEKIKPYRRIVDSLISNSSFTALSSKGFLQFLSKNDKMIWIHNITNEDGLEAYCPDLKSLQVINLGFVGGVRYFKENIALINKVKNDIRFKLFYIGKQNEDCGLDEYCTQHGISNVYFSGQYSNSAKPKIYENLAMINSIYGTSSLEVTTALPNRLYDSILFKKPILASKGTYLGNLVEEFGLGLAVDVFCDDIIALVDVFINNFDAIKFVASCNHFLQLINQDEQIFLKKLQSFLT